MKRPNWDVRAQRAERLAEAHPGSAAVLRFYAAVIQMQKRLYEAFCSEAPDLVTHFPLVLSLVEVAGNDELREHAHLLRDEWPDRWQEMIDDYRTGAAIENWEALFARAFLEPYTEFLVDRGLSQPGTPNLARCPRCGSMPQASVLRGAYQGSQRLLACSLCHSEWQYRRILCPRCGEGAFDELPVYKVEEFEHIRVETCETCKGYLLSIDVGRCPEAVPIVDELAAVPVNLWAAGKGYEKIHPNLLGL